MSDESLALQLLALRLAVILCHARRDPDLQGIALERSTTDDQVVRLRWRAGWDARYPQSAHLLREETIAWQKTPWTLEVLEAN